MFLHKHPYAPFLFEEATRCIVGTLPPPRFSTGELRSGDVDFCYGSRDGLLWPILDRIFGLNLLFENTETAVMQRKQFLKRHKLAICDIVAAAKREKIDATDLGMKVVELRDIFTYLETYAKIDTLLFTGGNSKNGPEYFFRKLAKERALTIETLYSSVPRQYAFVHPTTGKRIKTVSLTAPSGAANRAIGSMQAYKQRKTCSPAYNTFDFRVDQYRPFFTLG